MKKLLVILVLSSYLLTSSEADDIRDFQIEGMNIGDSLLDHFNRQEIEFLINLEGTFVYPDGKLKIIKTHTNVEDLISKGLKKTKTYDYAGVSFTDDKKFIIIGTSAYIEFTDINECNKKRKELKKEINDFLKIKPVDEVKKHAYDNYSKSYTTWFFFPNEENVSINCTDWSAKLIKERGWSPHLKVNISSQEYIKLLKKNYDK